MYKKARLNNGLRVITCSMPRMKSVALGVWIKAGGRYETQANKGVSHYLEHLLFKGTIKYSCHQIKESIEGVGGSLNGFTSEELSCYLVKLPSQHLDMALDILADMVINPKLEQEDIDKERTVILEELKMYRDLPQSYVYDLLDELLWPDQPLGMSIIGSFESVNRLNRQDLNSYKIGYYTPPNIVVSAAGLLDHRKFVEQVKSIFSGLKDEKESSFAPARENQTEPQLNMLHKETEQTHMAMGFHGFKRDHPLKHAFGLLHIILGGNMSSRLFNEVREKRGLAYEIGTHAKRFQDTGAFIVHAGMDNRKVEEAIKLILQELEKVKRDLVTEGEFKRAKEFYLGQLMLALEDTLDNMLWIGESTSCLDKVYTLEEVIQEVGLVKRQDLRDVAQDILKEKSLNLALIGPLNDKKDKICSLLRLS